MSLTDAEFVKLLSNKNLPKLFNQQLKRGLSAHESIYNDPVFPLYTEFINGTSEFKSINEAIKKVRADLAAFFGRYKNTNEQKARECVGSELKRFTG